MATAPVNIPKADTAAAGTGYSTETQLIYGQMDNPRWDYSHHLLPPISASATFRLDNVQRGAQGFTEFAHSSGELTVTSRAPIYIYDRLGEPNKDMLEENLACARALGAKVAINALREDVVRGGEGTGDVAGFLARAQKELRPTGVFISADVFGLTTATEDDQYTGQRLKDLGAYVDYISPMVYPDVWAASSDLLSRGLGIGNCAIAVRCPYDVIYNSYKRSAEKTSAKVRLWLQAYPGRGNFGIEQYKIQKKAAEEAGGTGWMFWNAAGSYDARMFDAR